MIDLDIIVGQGDWQGIPEIALASDGSAIIAYSDEFLSPAPWEDPEFSTTYRASLKLTKINLEGNFLWGDSGIVVTQDTVHDYKYTILEDRDGGIHVTRLQRYLHYGDADSIVTFLNHYDSAGTPLLGEGGRRVSLSSFEAAGDLSQCDPDGIYFMYYQNTVNLHYS